MKYLPSDTEVNEAQNDPKLSVFMSPPQGVPLVIAVVIEALQTN